MVAATSAEKENGAENVGRRTDSTHLLDRLIRFDSIPTRRSTHKSRNTVRYVCGSVYIKDEEEQ